MTYTIFTQFDCSFIASGHLANILERVKELAIKGHTINMVYCDKYFTNTCSSNLSSCSSICNVCMLYKNNLFSYLPKGINYIPLSKYQHLIQQDYSLPLFSNVGELKRMEYNGVKIGYAAFSTYLTLSRNLNPLFDNEFIDYMRKSMTICCQYSDIVRAIIKDTTPDIIGCFNSRVLYARPIVDIAKELNIKHLCYETTYNANGKQAKIAFNTTPHNVEENTRLINDLWNSTKLSQEEKTRIAEEFFYKRKHSIPSGDKLYVKDQVQGLMPQDWDNNKHNILILNSSEDEYAALGEEFENKSLFKSQLQGLKYMIDTFKDDKDYHFYLRVHPNLKGIKYQYHTKLYELFKHADNFTIIEPESKISTYALMDQCDKVVVFGSTTGPESAYLGKPTILLSYCIYSLLDICYTPKDLREFNAYIYNKDLKPNNKTNALKYGYYRMNDEYENYQYYKYEIKHIKILGKKAVICVYDINWIRKIYGIILQLIGKIFYEKYLWYPTKEDCLI